MAKKRATLRREDSKNIVTAGWLRTKFSSKQQECYREDAKDAKEILRTYITSGLIVFDVLALFAPSR
jgi:hypothetical protein